MEPPREPGQELEWVNKPYKDMVVGPLNQKPDMATPTPVSELGARKREHGQLAYPALDIRGDRRVELRRRTSPTSSSSQPCASRCGWSMSGEVML